MLILSRRCSYLLLPIVLATHKTVDNMCVGSYFSYEYILVNTITNLMDQHIMVLLFWSRAYFLNEHMLP